MGRYVLPLLSVITVNIPPPLHHGQESQDEFEVTSGENPSRDAAQAIKGKLKWSEISKKAFCFFTELWEDNGATETLC